MKLKEIYSKSLFLIASILPLSCLSQLNNTEFNLRLSVPEIAIVDIESGGGRIEFNLVPSSEPGGKPELRLETTEPVWINYSSSLRINGQKRSIIAQISQGVVPNGVALFLEASPPSSFGSRNQGYSNGKTQITPEPKPIISGIGSCFTGDGINMGHELIFSLEISDFSKMESIGSQEFTILYTITDN